MEYDRKEELTLVSAASRPNGSALLVDIVLVLVEGVSNGESVPEPAGEKFAWVLEWLTLGRGECAMVRKEHVS